MVVTLDDTIVHQARDQGVGEAADQRRGFATGRSMIVGSAPPTNRLDTRAGQKLLKKQRRAKARAV
jgi:hypothetical protein